MRKAGLCFALLPLLLPASPSRTLAQTPQPLQSTAAFLPYSFSNFAWWTDAQLRDELKQRIPGLGDDLATGSAQESRVREELTAMLLAKGVHATVVSTEPSAVTTEVSAFIATLPYFIPGGQSHRPHITFSISTPQILVGPVNVSNVPDAQSDLLAHIGQQMQGKPFDSGMLAAREHELTDSLQGNGYLSANVQVSPETPVLQGDHYLVPVNAAIDAGPVYHVGLVSADGGPLLRGRDLSTYFDLQPGQIATPYAFQRLESEIMTIYFQSGYASIHFMDTPILDREHGTATYRLEVVTGPQYRLRTVTVHNLSPEQEAEVRHMLELQPGDVYDQLAIDELHQKVQDSASLHGLDYSFLPQTDHQRGVIDLTLDFFKDTAQSSLQVGAGAGLSTN
jgi:outer membrane translocation and assembly module TamA